VSVPEQLTLDEEDDDGLTWHEWFLSLPPGEEEREPRKPRLEEAA
jgi:hypothetical protein